MRLIVLNDHGFINGGGAQVAIASLNALAKAGLDVTFVSSVGPIDESIDRTLVKTINFNHYDLRSNPSKMQAGFRGIWNFDSASRFAKVLEDFDPQDTIIHLHTWISSLSSSVVSIAVKKGFKVVCTLHDYSSICPNVGFYNFNKARNCELKPMSLACLVNNCDSRSYPHKLWRVVRQVAQNKLANFQNDIHLFIAVSSYSENLIRPLLPKTANIEIIGNPITISKEAPIDVRNNNLFTFVGRLSPEKGGILFAEAARIAKINSVFVGSGIEEGRIRAANPTSTFMGWQSREGVIRSIRASRAVVFPSLLHEAQPLVVMEAASLGVPVIASDECAARDAIIDGQTGLLFNARDPLNLSRKLELLNHEPDLAARLATNAYECYWNTPSTLEVHVAKLINCYKKILT